MPVFGGTKRALVYALGWACANGTKPGFFLDYADEAKTLAAITSWYHSLNCTAEQFHAALNFVIRTEDRIIEEEYQAAIEKLEKPPEKPQPGDLSVLPSSSAAFDGAAELDPNSKLEDLTRECLAAGPSSQPPSKSAPSPDPL